MDLTHIYFLNEIGGKANQEDFIWPRPGSASLHDKVFIVCDGVGGSNDGEVASRIVSESVGTAILRLEKREMSGVVVNALLSEARKTLINYAQQNSLNMDMATTFTLLVLSEKKVFISWCGDSRIYQIRDGKILYKTADHSLVNSLIKSGEITEEEALTHPRKNIILRAIKADDSPLEADHHLIEDVQHGDYFMLCTDGLLENITDKDLKFLLTQNDKGSIDLVKAFQQFCLGKTKDNYSMYLVKVSLNKKAGYKRKIMALVVFLAVLVSACAIIVSRYLEKKQHLQTAPVTEKQKDTTASKAADTTPVRITTKPGAANIANGTAAENKPVPVEPVADPVAAKSGSNEKIITLPPKPATKALIPNEKMNTAEKIKKDPVFIEVDNSADTILPKAKQGKKYGLFKDTSKPTQLLNDTLKK